MYRKIIIMLAALGISAIFVLGFVQIDSLERLFKLFGTSRGRVIYQDMRLFLRDEYKRRIISGKETGGIVALSEMIDNRLLTLEEIELQKQEIIFHVMITSMAVPLILLLIIIAVIFYGVRYLFHPLNRLTEAVSRYTREDAGSFPLAVKGTSEIRLLIEATNTMTQTISRQKEILKLQSRSLGWRSAAREIVHEIKNLLTPARLSAETIYEEALAGDTFKTETGRILRSLASLEEMSRSLKNLYTSRIPRPVEMDTRELSIKTAGVYLGLFPKIKITGEGAIVLADPELMESVLGNIITNAIEAIGDREGGEIIIALRGGDKPEIQCVDNGPGLDPEIVPHLFRLNATTRQRGSGFGLYYTKKVMTEHGYDVEIGNRHDSAGTTVRLIFHESNSHS